MNVLGLLFLLGTCISMDAMQCPNLPKRKSQAQIRAQKFQELKAQYKQDGNDPAEEDGIDFDPMKVDLFELIGAGDVQRLEQALQAGRSRRGLMQKGHTLRQFAEKMNNGTLVILEQYQPQRRVDLFKGGNDE